MKRSLFAAAAASALLLAACGDDSSSDSVSYSQSGSLYVDEAQRLIVMTSDVSYFDMCVVTETGLAWKSIPQPATVDSAIYTFLGDTLVLFDIDEGDTSHYGKLFAGGSAGDIYGTWTYLPCEYDSRTNEKECYEEEARYMTQTVKISQGKLVTTIDYHFDAYLSDVEDAGYMKTYFMKQLYNALSNGYHIDADASDIFDIYDAEDYEDFEKSIKRNNVQIIEESKDSQTFKIGEKTYTVTVENAEQSFEYNLYATTNVDASVNVSDGTKTCNSHTVRKIMDESLCKVENMEYLKIRDDVDEEYAYARYYRNSNEVEFEECIKSIAVEQTSNSYDDYYDYTLYKKANDKKEEFKKRSEKFLRKMSKYIEK